MTAPENQTPRSKKELWLELAKDAFGAERGFYFTVKALYRNPNDVFKSYLSGESTYVSPFGLLGVSMSIYYLLSGYLVNWTAVGDSMKWAFKVYIDFLRGSKAPVEDALYHSFIIPYVDGIILLASTYVIVLIAAVEIMIIPILSMFTRKHSLHAYHHTVAINYGLSLSFLMIDTLILVSLISPWLILPTYIASMFFLPKQTAKIYGDKQKVVGRAIVWSFLVFFLVCIVIGVIIGYVWAVMHR